MTIPPPVAAGPPAVRSARVRARTTAHRPPATRPALHDGVG
ncbi:hypothetical protein [Streptomyces mobaraensis]|nr:hypothetical protein [Streptomyces mobaraensis]